MYDKYAATRNTVASAVLPTLLAKSYMYTEYRYEVH